MKNNDLVKLNAALQQLSNIKGKEFAYAIFKNKSIVEKELEIFKKLQREPHPDFVNYEQERNILCITYSTKDESGNPKVVDNRYEIDPLQQVDFQNEFEDLKEKYADVIEDMMKAESDYNEFMEKESDVKLIKVGVDSLPDDIDANFLRMIQWMVE